MLNLMEKRNEILSYPLRKAGPPLLDILDKRSNSPPASQLGAMVLLAYAAAPTFVGNILLPAEMIMAGSRPLPVSSGISYKIHTAPLAGGGGAYWLEPRFHYRHGASPAYKAGARVGGKIGGRIGARLIPGLGWAMLAYDVYDVAVNQSLWGFDLS